MSYDVDRFVTRIGAILGLPAERPAHVDAGKTEAEAVEDHARLVMANGHLYATNRDEVLSAEREREKWRDWAIELLGKDWHPADDANLRAQVAGRYRRTEEEREHAAEMKRALEGVHDLVSRYEPEIPF